MGMTRGVTSKDLNTDLPAASPPVGARRGGGSGAVASVDCAAAPDPIALAPATTEKTRKARRVRRLWGPAMDAGLLRLVSLPGDKPRQGVPVGPASVEPKGEEAFLLRCCTNWLIV